MNTNKIYSLARSAIGVLAKTTLGALLLSMVIMPQVFATPSSPQNVSVSGDTTPTVSWDPVEPEPNGVEWEKEVETPGGRYTAPYGDIVHHTSVVFNEKFWVLGGNLRSGTDLNSVWSSSDGVDWTEVTASAPWSARLGHSASVFDDKLWIIAGGNGTAFTGSTTPLNDVWYTEDGVNWTEATASAPWSARAYHQAQAFDNKLWVMGGLGNSSALNDVWYTTDGINWVEATANAGWHDRYHSSSAVFDNKLWIMGGQGLGEGYAGNDVWSSSDGITWTEMSIPYPSAANQWNSVTYGNGLFVAVASSGTGNRVMTSPDGITWTIRTSAANNSWNSVTYGNGLFVAVASSGTGNRVMTSPDGITWTIRTSAANNSWNSVTYGNGLFVAVASSGTGNRVMTSPDGITWTIRTSAANNSWNSVTYGNGLFVAVASSGTGNRVMTSPDGITWTIRTSAANNSWNSVTYGNGIFVSVACGTSFCNATNGNRVMTSPDGINWTARDALGNDDRWQAVAFAEGVFVAVGHSAGGEFVAMNSSDGINWVGSTANLEASYLTFDSITYGEDEFIAIGAGSMPPVITSPDGSTWSNPHGAEWDIRKAHDSVVYDNKLWVIGGFGNQAATTVEAWYTSDGVSWTKADDWSTSQYVNQLTAAVFNNELVAILGNNIAHSIDGVEWVRMNGEIITTPVFPFTHRAAHQVESFKGKLWTLGGDNYQFGRDNDVWSSSNGTSWVQATDDANWSGRNSFATAVFKDKLWVMGGVTLSCPGNGGAFGACSDVWSSTDGVNWTQEISDAPWAARNGLRAVVFDEKLWILGGTANGGGNFNDVWYTTDGVNWTEATSSAAWPARNGHQVVVFNNKMWVIGGIQNFTTWYRDVWSSPDGINWTEETDDAGWLPRASHQAQTFADKMWVFSGSAQDWSSEYNDVWSSADGINWDQVASSTSWQARRGAASAVFNNRLWILGGKEGPDWNFSNGVYSTPNNTISHYKVCWDTTEGSCSNSAKVNPDGETIAALPTQSQSIWDKLTTSLRNTFTPPVYAQSSGLSYTLGSSLAPGNWYFSVAAVTVAGQESLLSESQLLVAEGATLADTGVNAIVQFIIAISAGALGLSLIRHGMFSKISYYRGYAQPSINQRHLKSHSGAIFLIATLCLSVLL